MGEPARGRVRPGDAGADPRHRARISAADQPLDPPRPAGAEAGSARHGSLAMIRRPLALLAALGLVAAAPAPAPSGDYPPMPLAGPPKPFQVPASETYRLPNGMQVTLIPYGQVPKATIGLLGYAGALNEGEDTGIASLTAQMMREGAAGHSGAQIAAATTSMNRNLDLSTQHHTTSIIL